MDPISLEDLALLEVLRRIDQRAELVDGDGEIRKRLLEGALAIEQPEGIALTPAGVELTKSLQHRVAADAQAEKLLKERNGDDVAATASATPTAVRVTNGG